MFCPKCGNADQQPESYCRKCGEFVADYSGSSYVLSKILGGSAPSTQINVNLFINLLTIFACFLLLGFLNGHYDAVQERTGEGPPTVIYLVYAFLVTISAWQIFSLVVGARLRAKLASTKHVPGSPDSRSSRNTLADADTNVLPPHHEEVPGSARHSVTEEPTKILNRTPPR